jgi:hypothetical protein
LLGHHAGYGAPEFPDMAGIFRCATGADFAVVLDKFHPEFAQLFSQFDIRELLYFAGP